MATNFPTGTDTFVDPTPSTLTNNAAQAHSTMHDIENDGLVAVQSYLLNNARTQLYKATSSTPFKAYHQGKAQIVAAGTFTASKSTYWLDVEMRVWNQGGAVANIVVVVGVNGGAPGTPLFAPNVGSGLTANTGVTEFQTDAFSFDYEAINADRISFYMSTLTAGRVYTWQVVAGMSGGSQTIATVGTNPYFCAISPDNKTLWVANNGDNTVEPVNIGFRPGWKIAGVPMYSGSAGPISIGAGTGPYGIAVSPNGQYVMVCNLLNTGNNSVTAINAKTHQIIGTSTTATTAGKSAVACSFTQDSTVCWVSSSDGKVYPYTMSLTAAPTQGTGVTVRNASDTLEQVLCHPDGKTLWVVNNTAVAVYAATLTSDTTLGAFSAATGLSGTVLGLVNLATPMTYGTVAASVSLTVASFSFSVTGVVGAFPPQSKTIQVPVSGGYAAVTYGYAVTSGTTTTFFNCTCPTGTKTSVAGTVIFDQGVWVSGISGAGVQYIPSAGGAAGTLITAAHNVTGTWISADNEELWITTGASQTIEVHQLPTGEAVLAASALGVNSYSVVGSSDGYVYLTQYPAGKGSIFNFLGGTCTIDPTFGIVQGRLVVAGRG